MKLFLKTTLAFLLCASTTALAKPAWMSEVNLTGPGKHRNLAPVELTYLMSWNGAVGAGKTTIRLGYPDPRYPNHFIAQSYGMTTGAPRKLFPFDFNYTSFLAPKDFRPSLFLAQEITKKDLKNTRTEFLRSGVTSKQTKTKRKSGAVKNSTRSFAFPQALDVHAAVLWVRSLDMKPNQQAVFAVMPFKTPYLCRVTMEGREIRNTQRTVRYDLRLERINRDTLELEDYDKVKSLKLWVSDDAERIPLEFRSKVFIGDVRGKLVAKRNP